MKLSYLYTTDTSIVSINRRKDIKRTDTPDNLCPRPNSFPQLVSEHLYPCGQRSSLLNSALERTFKVEKISVKTALFGEICEEARIVR